MARRLDIAQGDLDRLERDPRGAVAGSVAASRFEARIAIPDYARRIAEHYGVDPDDAGVPLDFRHFGLVCEFDRPTEIPVCDEERRLDDGLRDVVRRFGTVILRNAHLGADLRQGAQRNIFSSLQFHFDRGATQPDQHSLFFRDPFDPVHRKPRGSSTLIVANLVAYLQSLREGRGPHEFASLYTIFGDEDIDALGGRIVLRQPWTAPEGTGELCILDNRTVLHASYYEREKGYPIGVRYLI
jgi:hypothetical protein